jgi:C-terminal processing protease CtpA/Prc
MLIKNYNRNLHFMKKTVVSPSWKLEVLTKEISDLLQSFRKIDSYKSKTLILDLRDNGGGRLNEIVDLYSYLADSTFVFWTNLR